MTQTKFADIPLDELLDDLAESRADLRTHQVLRVNSEHERITVNRKIIYTIKEELAARGESVPESKWVGVP